MECLKCCLSIRLWSDLSRIGRSVIIDQTPKVTDWSLKSQDEEKNTQTNKFKQKQNAEEKRKKAIAHNKIEIALSGLV